MCAAVLKHWREAATVIIVNSRKSAPLLQRNVLPQSQSNKQLTELDAEDFEVLTLKRSGRSRFMPDMYVFPGGKASDADFSQEWLDIFRVTESGRKERLFAFANPISENAPMFHRKREAQFSSIPSEISFRISAIRETFEESGVLLARSWDYVKNSYLIEDSSKPESCTSYHFDMNHPSNLIKEWRHKVTSNPALFLTMCKELEIVPDVWSLYDWSNWMTPPTDILKQNRRRFDTAFYICCLVQRPYVAEDATETVHFQWTTPNEILQYYRQGKLQLAPPQFYEMSRLIRFSSIESLLHFSNGRRGQPMEHWMPFQIQCADAVLLILPGDSLYPENPDYNGVNQPVILSETLEELTQKSPKLHRAVCKKLPQSATSPLFTIQCNITLPYGHVAPLSD